MSTICILDHKRIREGRERRNAVISTLENAIKAPITFENIARIAESMHALKCLRAIKRRPYLTGAERDVSFKRVLLRLNGAQ
jgi:hypothetical protein